MSLSLNLSLTVRNGLLDTGVDENDFVVDGPDYIVDGADYIKDEEA